MQTEMSVYLSPAGGLC